MANNTDLLIANDDLVLGPDLSAPELIEGRSSIAQDIKHMIRETGLLVQMIAERDINKRGHSLKLIEIEVEEDQRIKPGTAKVTENKTGLVFIEADTINYGPFQFAVTI